MGTRCILQYHEGLGDRGLKGKNLAVEIGFLPIWESNLVQLALFQLFPRVLETF